jgi:hypothetical protein
MPAHYLIAPNVGEQDRKRVNPLKELMNQSTVAAWE